MIPSNFKDILANVENAGFYQTLSMILFILFFVATIYFVISKPKNIMRM
jgi:preprotein translocase subunit YajC